MKEGFTTIKMDKRMAMRLLNQGGCRVQLKTNFGEWKVGYEGIKYHGSKTLIWIPQLGKHVEVQEIKSIEFENRFGCISFMEVDWE